MNCVVVGGGVVVSPPLYRGHVTVVGGGGVGGDRRHGILGNSWERNLKWFRFESFWEGGYSCRLKTYYSERERELYLQCEIERDKPNKERK